MIRGSNKPQSDEAEEKAAVAVRRQRLTGLYRKYDINQLDGRTGVSKTIMALTKELEDYVGPEVTVAASLLIQRIVYKHMRLSSYENAWVENPVEDAERPHYLPMANSLRLDLQALKEMAGQRKPPPDLHAYVKGRYHEVKGKIGGDDD